MIQYVCPLPRMPTQERKYRGRQCKKTASIRWRQWLTRRHSVYSLPIEKTMSNLCSPIFLRITGDRYHLGIRPCRYPSPANWVSDNGNLAVNCSQRKDGDGFFRPISSAIIAPSWSCCVLGHQKTSHNWYVKGCSNMPGIDSMAFISFLWASSGRNVKKAVHYSLSKYWRGLVFRRYILTILDTVIHTLGYLPSFR